MTSMFNKKHFQELVYDYSSHERKTNNVLKRVSNSFIHLLYYIQSSSKRVPTINLDPNHE